MSRLVLLRHGQSTWNKSNQFTGWTDVDLTEQGVEEARSAGRTMQREGLVFDVAYTSLLKRAIKTLAFALEEMDLLWLPVHKNWRLNERHYGALQGLDKAQTAAQHGDEKVKLWRRSYDVPPPPLDSSDPRHPIHDPRYADLDPRDLPATECLADTVARFLPYWHLTIAPAIRAGQRVLVAAHGNSLRALVKYLDDVSETDILELNIPTGIPLVYDLDQQLRPVRHRYLGDPAQVQAATQAVANQAKRR